CVVALPPPPLPCFATGNLEPSHSSELFICCCTFVPIDTCRCVQSFFVCVCDHVTFPKISVTGALWSFPIGRRERRGETLTQSI
uniref:Uncharacterized protein n=1 Tax=Anopheles quadriannulatus TaxID=34691 RepID=A0A182XR35_ANOQN